MSRAELRQPAVKWQEMQWATAPAPDDEEESEIVAQFLTLPYSYQSDQLDQEESHELSLGGNGVRACSSSMSMYWPPADHGAACCWPSSGDSSRSAGAVGGGGYFDDGCCYDYLGKPDVSLGINTLSCSAAINLNLAGEEEIGSECARLVPDDPSPAVRVRAGYLNDGDVMRLQPKRKVQAGQEGWDLGRCKKKARPADHKKQGKKAVSNTVKKCSSSGSSHCSDNESNCSQEKRSAEDHVAGGGGGTAKARASRGSATDPQSLYAKRRRERINDRLRMLQKLVPNGTKVDISTMLEEAVLYVKFLQQQIKMLSSDDMWMYAPIAYNGMSLGIDLRIPLPH